VKVLETNTYKDEYKKSKRDKI